MCVPWGTARTTQALCRASSIPAGMGDLTTPALILFHGFFFQYLKFPGSSVSQNSAEWERFVGVKLPWAGPTGRPSPAGHSWALTPAWG